MQGGGRLGFAGCSWGCLFLRCLRATPHVGEHGSSGRCPQLRSDTEAMESGWDDRGPGEKENGTQVGIGKLRGGQPGSVL